MSGVGLSFGNTSICVACCKNKECSIVVNEFGERTTPSILTNNERNFTVNYEANFHHETISHIKYVLNANSTNDKKDVESCSFDNKLDHLLMESKSINLICKSKTKILNVLFSEVYKMAYNCCMVKNVPIIMAIPPNCHKEFQKVVLATLKKLGFNVKQLLHEPIAALMFFNSKRNDTYLNGDVVLCYKIGGFGSNLCKISIHNGLYAIDSYEHFDNLGSNLITNAIFSYLLSSIETKFKTDLKNNQKTLTRIKKEAEMCKKMLSKMSSYQIMLESIYDGMDWNQTMTSVRFDSIIRNDIEKILSKFKQCLDDNCVGSGDDAVKKIFLYGGGFRLPILRKMVMNLCTNSKLEVIFDENSDEVITMGCAIQLNYLMQTNLNDNNLYPTIDSDFYLTEHDIAIIDKNCNTTLASFQKYSENNENISFDYKKKCDQKILLDFHETFHNKHVLFEKEIQGEHFRIHVSLNFSTNNENSSQINVNIEQVMKS